jgi:hypothetical protein
MTHTEVSRNVENYGSLKAEVLEIDISSLDNAGVETGVSPEHLDDVQSVSSHVSGGTGEVVSWDETNDQLLLTDGAGSQVADNSTVNGVRVTFIGRR